MNPESKGTQHEFDSFFDIESFSQSSNKTRSHTAGGSRVDKPYPYTNDDAERILANREKIRRSLDISKRIVDQCESDYTLLMEKYRKAWQKKTRLLSKEVCLQYVPEAKRIKQSKGRINPSPQLLMYERAVNNATKDVNKLHERIKRQGKNLDAQRDLIRKLEDCIVSIHDSRRHAEYIDSIRELLSSMPGENNIEGLIEVTREISDKIQQRVADVGMFQSEIQDTEIEEDMMVKSTTDDVDGESHLNFIAQLASVDDLSLSSTSSNHSDSEHKMSMTSKTPNRRPQVKNLVEKEFKIPDEDYVDSDLLDRLPKVPVDSTAPKIPGGVEALGINTSYT